MSGLLTGGIASTVGAAMRGLFLDATLTRTAYADPAEDWLPGAATETEYTCKAIHETWGASWLAGGMVGADEVKLLILASTLAVEPIPGDRVTIREAEYTIVPAGSGKPPVSTDPAKAVWECRAKR